MDLSKIHITTLYAMAVSIAPVLVYLDGYVAHAEDLKQTKVQMMLQMRQQDIRQSQVVNQLMYKMTTNDDERFILNQQKVMLMKDQNELDKIRQDIK